MYKEKMGSDINSEINLEGQELKSTPDLNVENLEVEPTENEQIIEQLDILGQSYRDITFKGADLEAKTLTSNLSEQERSSLIEKIRNASQGAFKYLRNTVLMISMASTFQHNVEAMPNPEYLTAQTPESNYKHSDPETTHNLNVLSGKERFTLEEQAALFRELVKGIYRDKLAYRARIEGEESGRYDLDIDRVVQELDRMTPEELVKFGNDTLGWKYEFVGPVESDEEYLAKYFDHWGADPSLDEFDPELHQAYWQLNMENGDPKVRITIADGNAINRGDGISNYDPITNTITINIREPFRTPKDTYIAELSHSKQFNDSFWASSYQSLRDGVGIVKKVLLENKPFQVSLLETYHVPGSMEHEAHKIIEPELEKQFDELTPTSVSKKEKLRQEFQFSQQLVEKEYKEKEIRLSDARDDEIFAEQARFFKAVRKVLGNQSKVDLFSEEHSQNEKSIREKYSKLFDDLSNEKVEKLESLTRPK